VLQVSRDGRISNTELHLLAVWASAVANQSLAFTAFLIFTIVMVTLTNTGSVFADSAFRANNSCTWINRSTSSAMTDRALWTGHTSTWIVWNTSAILASRSLWTLNASTWIVWNALSIDTSTILTHHIGTWVRWRRSSAVNIWSSRIDWWGSSINLWSYTLSTNALSAFWTLDTSTWVRSDACSVLARCAFRAGHTSTRIIRNAGSTLAS